MIIHENTEIRVEVDVNDKVTVVNKREGGASVSLLIGGRDIVVNNEGFETEVTENRVYVVLGLVRVWDIGRGG